jgi:hypothetical protein
MALALALRGDPRFKKILASRAPAEKKVALTIVRAGTPSRRRDVLYRKRSGVGAGLSSSVGEGVSEGSASGLGEGDCFFLGFFAGSLSTSTSTYVRRWRLLPVCKGITTSLYLLFLEDFGFFQDSKSSQPAPPKAKQTRTKMANKR